MTYLDEINQIEKEINEKSLEQARLQERLKTLEEEQTKLETEITTLGYDVVTLEETLHNLEVEIQEGLEQCKEQLK